MSPLYFLGVSIYGFLPLPKSVKFNRRICIILHFNINARIYSIYIQWELNTGPTRHATVVSVCISLVWVDHHHGLQKWPQCLLAAVNGSLMLIYFLIHHEDSNSLSWKRLGQKFQWSVTINWIFYSACFPPGFLLVLQCQQNRQTGLWPIWRSLLLLLKLLALLSCKTCAFSL